MLMILLASGGLDSFIAWNYLNKPKILFVDYGQKYINIERNAITKLYHDFEFVKLDGICALEDKIFVPARNLMLATLGLRYSTYIAFGGVKDEICKDKSPLAFKLMSNILSKFNERQVTVFSPIWHMTKTDAVKYFIDNFDKELLKDTVSCYSEKICNSCESCFRRFVALASNGLIEQDRLPTDDAIYKFLDNIKLQPKSRIVEAIRALAAIESRVSIKFNGETATLSYKGVDAVITNQKTIGYLLQEI